ncbi:hypothetical protein FOBRF1_006533 [Fusarium oxysporum]
MNRLLLIALTATGATASTNNMLVRQLSKATCQDVVEAGLGGQGWTCCKDGTTPCAPGQYCSLGESDVEWACCPNGKICGNQIGNGGTISKTTVLTPTYVDETPKTTTAVEYPVETTSVVAEPPKDTSSAAYEPPKDTTLDVVEPPNPTESSVYVPPVTTVVPVVPTPGSNGTKPDTTLIATAGGSLTAPNVLGGLLAGALALLI